MIRYCFLGCLLLFCQAIALAKGVASDINQKDVARLKALPQPLQSADGAFYVSCATAERASWRWPILRFTETVRTHLSDTFLPLGTSAAPLLIEIGAETNAVATIERRSFRTGDGFAQLILRVPNPETVELEVFREAVGEALLREKFREQTGRYAGFSWPKWWLRAVVNASKGNVWKAEAYERFQTAIRQTTPPTLRQLFFADSEPDSDAAAFLAMWVLNETVYQKRDQRVALLTQPWDVDRLLQILDEGAWQTWLAEQDTVILLPGTITYSQFLRWQSTLADPQSTDEAMRLATAISRAMIGRPQPFCDLSELYLRAYSAYVNGGLEAYRPLRKEADEAAHFLEQYLKREKLLSLESLSLSSSSLTPAD